jgi:hypothetical protein
MLLAKLPLRIPTMGMVPSSAAPPAREQKLRAVLSLAIDESAPGERPAHLQADEEVLSEALALREAALEKVLLLALRVAEKEPAVSLDLQLQAHGRMAVEVGLSVCYRCWEAPKDKPEQLGQKRL